MKPDRDPDWMVWLWPIAIVLAIIGVAVHPLGVWMLALCLLVFFVAGVWAVVAAIFRWANR